MGCLRGHTCTESWGCTTPVNRVPCNSPESPGACPGEGSLEAGPAFTTPHMTPPRGRYLLAERARAKVLRCCHTTRAFGPWAGLSLRGQAGRVAEAGEVLAGAKAPISLPPQNPDVPAGQLPTGPRMPHLPTPTHLCFPFPVGERGEGCHL